MDDPAPTLGGNRFLQIQHDHRALLVDHLACERGLAELVLRSFAQIDSLCAEDEDLTDLVHARNLSSLGAILRAEYVPALPRGVREEADAELEQLVDASARDFVRNVDGEVRSLAAAVCRVMDVLDHLAGLQEHGRVVLLEMPVGNSIPCKVLHPVLTGRGYRVATVRTALSRNDAKMKGVTRAELLQAKLSDLPLQDDDLVLYVDEWFSGANFEHACDAVQRLVRGTRRFFLPAGLLLVGAETDPHYQRRCMRHDALLAGLTSSPADLRVVILPSASRYPREPGFFWSEHDRTSGYRKMQFLGSMFSSFDAGIQELHDNHAALLEAKQLFIRHVREQGKMIPSELEQDETAWVEVFERSYADYVTCRGRIAAVDHVSNLGDVGDVEVALREVLDEIETVLQDRRGQICLAVAAFYARKRFRVEIDPEDRYHFKNHVPVVSELEGHLRTFHEAVMKYIGERIAELLHGAPRRA